LYLGASPTHATCLLADAEVAATYRLFNIDRSKLQRLFHRVFRANGPVARHPWPLAGHHHGLIGFCGQLDLKFKSN
jgi:hypothetical protein